MRPSTCAIFGLVMLLAACARHPGEPGIQPGHLTIIESHHSPFPHPARLQGHVYDDSLYSYQEHYRDSSVAIFVPPQFKAGNTVDLVFYFHGWGSNIHRSLEKFRLQEQFSSSGRNAVFVFPEGPRDAPDSFGGRLEEQDAFMLLVADVMAYLRSTNLVRDVEVGNITLSGHSGAYRVIAYILDRGGLSEHIDEVFLFDALYAEEDKYASWLETSGGRLINIITPNGGTLDNSLILTEMLAARGIETYRFDTDSITAGELADTPVAFIFTGLGHNEVIDPFFSIFLSSGQH